MDPHSCSLNAEKIGGGVFLLNTRDVEEAKSIMESLPLAKENMLDHEYILVGPLMPLRLLMGNQSAEQ
jgi:hypothetical protein